MPLVDPAPEGRKNLASGASPWTRRQRLPIHISSNPPPPSGERTNPFFPPCGGGNSLVCGWGSWLRRRGPRACARGYILPPLRGWGISVLLVVMLTGCGDRNVASDPPKAPAA